MKLSCQVAEDLLPLYHDEVCSEESRALVEEHLQSCPHCRALLQQMDEPLPQIEEAKPLKEIGRQWKRKKRLAQLRTALIVLVSLALVFGVWRFAVPAIVSARDEAYGKAHPWQSLDMTNVDRADVIVTHFWSYRNIVDVENQVHVTSHQLQLEDRYELTGAQLQALSDAIDAGVVRAQRHGKTQKWPEDGSRQIFIYFSGSSGDEAASDGTGKSMSITEDPEQLILGNLYCVYDDTALLDFLKTQTPVEKKKWELPGAELMSRVLFSRVGYQDSSVLTLEKQEIPAMHDAIEQVLTEGVPAELRSVTGRGIRICVEFWPNANLKHELFLNVYPDEAGDLVEICWPDDVFAYLSYPRYREEYGYDYLILPAGVHPFAEWMEE